MLCGEGVGSGERLLMNVSVWGVLCSGFCELLRVGWCELVLEFSFFESWFQVGCGCFLTVRSGRVTLVVFSDWVDGICFCCFWGVFEGVAFVLCVLLAVFAFLGGCTLGGESVSVGVLLASWVGSCAEVVCVSTLALVVSKSLSRMYAGDSGRFAGDVDSRR